MDEEYNDSFYPFIDFINETVSNINLEEDGTLPLYREIAWDFEKDTYVYIPENNLDHMLGYDEILDKDLVVDNPLDAVIKYNEIEEHKKSWVEKTVTFKNGKIH